MSLRIDNLRKVGAQIIFLVRYTTSNNSQCLPCTKFNSGWKSIRMFSSSTKDKYVIKSSRPSVQIPAVSLDQFVWRDLDKWSDKIAVECGVTGRKLTYGESRSWSKSLASGLQNQFHLAAGDCFAILSPNLPEYPLLLLAAAEARIVATTINPLYTPDEISKQLKDSKAKLVITTPACFPNACAAVISLGLDIPILVIKDSPEAVIPKGGIPLDDVLHASSGKLQNIDIDFESNVVLPYSSGTSGLPKGVQLSHTNLVANLLQMEVPGVRLLLETTQKQQDVVLALLPMFHIYGMVVVALTTLASGGKLVTIPRFEPQLFIKMLVEHQVGLLYLVPPLILFLAGHPDVKSEDLKFVRAINSGAAPIGLSDVERFVKKAPHIMMNQGYGMTEMSPVALMSCRERLNKFASTGIPLSNTDAKVVDVNTGDSLPANQVGELYFRGPQVMKGYLNRADANEDVFSDGWLRTGDIGYYDDQGDFFIVDRLKELIKVKGFQVAPAELEALLREHPKIADAAVICVQDERSGEKPRAFVVAKAGETLEPAEVMSFVASRAAEYKQLTGGVTILPAIPKSTAGKILRKELRAKYKTPAS